MLGTKLKQLRTGKGMTQAELASRLGLTPKMVSFYELDQRVPPIDILKKLCGILGVDANYLLDVSSKPVEQASVSLNGRELALLAAYRKLSAENKDFIDLCMKKALETQD